MGLDACVYCDCYEKGLMRTAPPQPELVYVDENGQVSLKWEIPGADQHAFYSWLEEACDHGPLGEIVSHRLGNISGIGFLRHLLSQTEKCFPVLLAKVIYSGAHAGGALSLDEAASLRPELDRLREVRCQDAGDERFVRRFERQMSELVEVSLKIGKPIVF